MAGFFAALSFQEGHIQDGHLLDSAERSSQVVSDYSPQEFWDDL